MIERCSEDLPVYLADYFREFVNTHNEVADNIREEYVARTIHWTLQILIGSARIQNFSMELHHYIFVLLHDQHFSRVSKVVINSLNSLCIDRWIWKENVFLQDDTINNMEKMICLATASECQMS